MGETDRETVMCINFYFSNHAMGETQIEKERYIDQLLFFQQRYGFLAASTISFPAKIEGRRYEKSLDWKLFCGFFHTKLRSTHVIVNRVEKLNQLYKLNMIGQSAVLGHPRLQSNPNYTNQVWILRLEGDPKLGKAQSQLTKYQLKLSHGPITMDPTRIIKLISFVAFLALSQELGIMQQTQCKKDLHDMHGCFYDFGIGLDILQ